MKIIGFEVRVDHIGRVSLFDLHYIACEQGYNQPLSVEDFISSDYCNSLIRDREWMIHDFHADNLVALKYCERINLEFMFDVYYALGL